MIDMGGDRRQDTLGRRVRPPHGPKLKNWRSRVGEIGTADLRVGLREKEKPQRDAR
jgi:hypothetical protein